MEEEEMMMKKKTTVRSVPDGSDKNLENKSPNSRLVKMISWQKLEFVTQPKMQFSETCSIQRLIFPSQWYNYVSRCIVMQKKFEKTKNKILNAMVLKIKFWKEAHEIFRFCVDVLTHLYCLKMLQTLLHGSGIKFLWFSFF